MALTPDRTDPNYEVEFARKQREPMSFAEDAILMTTEQLSSVITSTAEADAAEQQAKEVAGKKAADEAAYQKDLNDWAATVLTETVADITALFPEMQLDHLTTLSTVEVAGQNRKSLLAAIEAEVQQHHTKGE